MRICRTFALGAEHVGFQIPDSKFQIPVGFRFQIPVGFRFQIPVGFRFQIPVGFQIPDCSRIPNSNSRFQIPDSKFQFRIPNSRFRFQIQIQTSDLDFGIWNLEFRYRGSTWNLKLSYQTSLNKRSSFVSRFLITSALPPSRTITAAGSGRPLYGNICENEYAPAFNSASTSPGLASLGKSR